MNEDIQTPATEPDIADAIYNAPSIYARLTIRRLAFERDSLRKALETIRILSGCPKNDSGHYMDVGDEIRRLRRIESAAVAYRNSRREGEIGDQSTQGAYRELCKVLP